MDANKNAVPELEAAGVDVGRLAIYLNDHLAGSMAGREVAERCRSRNLDDELGSDLRSFLEDLAGERERLAELIEQVGAARSQPKELAAWVGEKVARAKLNGQVVGYSPLSRLEELEFLVIGVEGKRALWSALVTLSEAYGVLDAAEFRRLRDTAQSQQRTLEKHRLKAVRSAFENEQILRP